jgi:hypothetical protein
MESQARGPLAKGSDLPGRWGLRLHGDSASLDPVAFVHQLATEGAALLDDLLGALRDDLGVPADPVEEPTPDPTLRRLRLLAGLAR